MLPDLDALLAEYPDQHLVVLASGDPLVAGIGSTLIDRLGPDHVRILPAVSSVSLARATMGWASGSYDVVTVVGGAPHAVLAHLRPGCRLIVLSSDEHTPAQLATLMVGAGYGQSLITVLGDLGSERESRISGIASDWAHDSPRLNLVCLELVLDPGSLLLAGIPGLPDAAFEHDGQLVGRDARAAALSRLAPIPGQLLWDVGAGAGSVAIEWSRTDSRCAAIALEENPDRALRIARNAYRLGVPGVQIINAAAPDALADLPAPDAVFIGGGATVTGMVQTCWAALRPGGRMVVHGSTPETDALLAEKFRLLGGELIRVSVQHAAPPGSSSGWTDGCRAVTQWSVTKGATEDQIGPGRQAESRSR